jgi:hypothetical protein
VCVPISSTKISRSGSTRSATITFQAYLKNSPRSSAPTVRFLGGAEPLHQPPYGRVAKALAGYVFQKAASLRDGRGRALLHVLQEHSGFRLPCGAARALLGPEGVSPTGGPRVALYRGEAHVEQAGGLSFWHTPLYSGDYLLSEVF